LVAKIDNLVTAQAISKYERDESMPSSRVLIALANALDVSPEYLISDWGIQLEGIEFRKKKPVTKREETRVEARVLDMLERYLTVEEILHLPSSDSRYPP
jgi:transcriptional regulator with XRE-family HTH domain